MVHFINTSREASAVLKSGKGLVKASSVMQPSSCTARISDILYLLRMAGSLFYFS